MPRMCTICTHANRTAIDKAIVSGESLRNIAKRVSVSLAALFRHKTHAAEAIVKAQERREEKRGLDLLVEAERVRRKAWEILERLEAEGDNRGSVVALRECRECLDTLGNLLTRQEARSAEVITFAEAQVLFCGMAHLVREHVKDKEALRAIAEGFAKLTQGPIALPEAVTTGARDLGPAPRLSREKLP